MNILLFLTPKREVEYLFDDYSIRQALEKMEYHRYTAIPILKRNGEYVGTLTEGDILWYLKNKHNLNIFEAEDVKIMDIPRKHDNKPVSASTKLSDIFDTAINQNFIPVIDDEKHFIGIITRKKIMNHLASKND
jgi:CBS domain-containing protein